MLPFKGSSRPMKEIMMMTTQLALADGVEICAQSYKLELTKIVEQSTITNRQLSTAALHLSIWVVPTLQLDLGSNLNPEDIEEGDDVYFECKVHANPAAYKVIWKHNVS
uniref:Ig-like domain-containing protein n=1 Tax=Glossina austeni TaxID=7395 RepID=A0A1A9USK6_GLOAU